MIKIGSNLERIRRIKNFTQEKTAKVLNISPQSVSKWEKDKAVPSLDLLVKLAGIYGVTLDQIVEGNKIYALGEIYDEYNSNAKDAAVLEKVENEINNFVNTKFEVALNESNPYFYDCARDTIKAVLLGLLEEGKTSKADYSFKKVAEVLFLDDVEDGKQEKYKSFFKGKSKKCLMWANSILTPPPITFGCIVSTVAMLLNQ